jgi:hypothetical protein
MNLDRDEMVVWEEESNMVIHGEVTKGFFIMTNKRMMFIQVQEIRPSLFMRGAMKDVEIWELGIWKVLDLNMMDINGFNHPLVRIRYKEGEAFFTFPRLEPRPAYAAMVVFLNHARLIQKNTDLLENIKENLRSGELKIGERLPQMVIDQPMRPDETCHQCAKTMLEEETNKLSSEINECLVCMD